MALSRVRQSLKTEGRAAAGAAQRVISADSKQPTTFLSCNGCLFYFMRGFGAGGDRHPEVCYICIHSLMVITPLKPSFVNPYHCLGEIVCASDDSE